MIQVNIYLKYGYIEKYKIDSGLEYIICKIKNYMRTQGLPLNFNGRDYMSNEIQKAAIFEENTVFIIEKTDECIFPTDLKNQLKNCISCPKQTYCKFMSTFNSCTCTEQKRLYHFDNELIMLCTKCHKERVCNNG